MLLPPAASFLKMPSAISPSMSRKCSIRRAFCDLRPFGRCELTFKAIHQLVHHHLLSAIQRGRLMSLPELSLGQYRSQYGRRAFESPVEAAQEPIHPLRDVEIALLRRFEKLIVVVTLLLDLCRHAIEALRTLLRSREHEVGKHARDAPVAIVERMNRLYPVGNSDACQPNSRAFVSGSLYFCVASSIMSTTPSTLRSAGASAPMSMPRRRARTAPVPYQASRLRFHSI
jgi:hypothetical protein